MSTRYSVLIDAAHPLATNFLPRTRPVTLHRSGFALQGIMSKSGPVKHSKLVSLAVDWLRNSYGCGIILSEQYCATGEIPDAIGWKGFCHSVVVECKASRADFLADAVKPVRLKPEEGLGVERLYLAPVGIIKPEELPKSWGLLEFVRRDVRLLVKPKRTNQRTLVGLMKEMNLLLASLRRVEIRIEPQTITDFLKWKNRMAEYNGGFLPAGIASREANSHLAQILSKNNY